MNTPDPKRLIEHESPYRYTNEGRELEARADQALLPLFAEFLDRGYSPYEITSVLYESVAEISREIVATHKTEGKEAATQRIKYKINS